MPIPFHVRMSQSRAGAPALLIIALAAVSVWWLSGKVAREDYRNILSAAVLFQAIWVFFRWRASVYVFMVYVVAEGFLINYFYTVPELNLLKDAFIVSLFGVLAVTTVPRGIFPLPRTNWFIPFTLFAVIYVAQVFNPYLPNILVGLVGLRVGLLYAVLVPVAYWFFDTRQRVLHFFLFLTLLSVPVSLFGIFQYFAGPNWLIALSPGFSRAVFYAAGTGGGSTQGYYFRTISTFVQTGGFAIYLCFMMLLAVAQMNMPRLRNWRWWIISAFVLQFLAAITTGGRAPLVMFLVAATLLMTMQRRMAKVVPVLTLVGLVFMGAVILFGDVVAERFGTLLDMEGVQARNVPLAVGWLYEAMRSDFAGMGAGYATIASRHAGATDLNQVVVENTFAKVRFETGLPGLLLYFIFILCVIWECIRTPLRLPDRELAWLVGACSAFILVNVFLALPWGTPFDISPTNIYLWFFLGLLGRAPHLLTEKRALEMTAAERADLHLSNPAVPIL